MNAHEQRTPDPLFRFHWLDGAKQLGRGKDAADALNRMGYGQGAVAALDYWEQIPRDEEKNYV